jgi:hypothetical protein
VGGKRFGGLGGPLLELEGRKRVTLSRLGRAGGFFLGRGRKVLELGELIVCQDEKW